MPPYIYFTILLEFCQEKSTPEDKKSHNPLRCLPFPEGKVRDHGSHFGLPSPPHPRWVAPSPPNMKLFSPGCTIFLDKIAKVWYNTCIGSGFRTKGLKLKKKTTLPNTAGRKAAQKKYNAKPEQVKRRAARNKTRAKLMREGKVRKGDGKDVDHKNHNPMDQSKGNLRVQSKSKNRSNNR